VFRSVLLIAWDDKIKQKVIRHVGIADNDSHLEELKKVAEVLFKKLKEEETGPTLFDISQFTKKQPDPEMEEQSRVSSPVT
jgi:hypothetical protein